MGVVEVEAVVRLAVRVLQGKEITAARDSPLQFLQTGFHLLAVVGHRQ
jgi:hypothetical protein